jgi:hypothetical protein
LLNESFFRLAVLGRNSILITGHNFFQKGKGDRDWEQLIQKVIKERQAEAEQAPIAAV